MEEALETRVIKIEDIIPEKPEFYVRKLDKRFSLRLVDLDDSVWIRSKIGSAERLQEICSKLEWEEICKIVFRLLEDKSDFMAYECEEINDDGEKIRVKVSGPRALLKAVTGLEEGVKMLGALNSSMAKSNPIVDRALREEVKKKIAANQTGERSSTPSPVNTDGPSSTSGAGPSGRLQSP